MTACRGCATVGDMVDGSTCNAVNRRGSRLLICELPLGHLKEGEEHRMGEETWPEPKW